MPEIAFTINAPFEISEAVRAQPRFSVAPASWVGVSASLPLSARGASFRQPVHALVGGFRAG